MINWWLSLTISQQVALALALASTFVLLIDVVLLVVNFYGMDKLNVEPENIVKYEVVANYDSDMFKNKARLITVKNVNVFIAISCWLYFGLWSVLSLPVLIIVSLSVGLLICLIEALMEKWFKNV